MDNLPATWTALCLLAFGLGMKHGFDADHLATIDGITRYNARTNPRLARVVGSLFSLGHGAVVLLVALVAGSLSSGWQTPAWLEVTGVGVSIVFLFGLAFVNVRAVLTAAPDAVVAPAGFKGRLLGRFVTVRRRVGGRRRSARSSRCRSTRCRRRRCSRSPPGASAASREALLVAGLFVLGMLVVDGINGVWISRLIRRADRTAVVASRVMALHGRRRSASPSAASPSRSCCCPRSTRGPTAARCWWAPSVVTAVLAAFAVGMRVARQRVAAAGAHRGLTHGGYMPPPANVGARTAVGGERRLLDR